MNVTPTGHHVLIELEQTEKKTPGGILIPEKTKDREQAGAQISRVLAVGPNAWAEHVRPWAQVGDRVVTIRYPGAQYDHDGEDKRKRIINDDEIIGIVENGEIEQQL